MDLPELVGAAVGAVADRIASAGPAGATRLTDSVVDRVYAIVAEQLNRSAIGARFLRALETRPTDTAARRDVAQAVAAEAESDASFAAELRRLTGQLTVGASQHGAFGPGSVPVGGQPFSNTGSFGVGGAVAGHDQISNPRRNLTLSTGGVMAILAGAVALLLISSTILVNVVLPQAGITEGGRVDRLEGTWTGQDGRELTTLTVRSDATVTVSRGWPCPGRVTSPGRSEYLFEIDCGLIRFSMNGKLNLLGNKLTLTAPGEPESFVFSRG